MGPDGSVYIAESFNSGTTVKLRKVDPNGIITTIAGGNGPVTPGGSVINSEGDGGLATNAYFQSIVDVAVGADGSIYLADYRDNRVRRIDTNGVISTIAGTGVGGDSGDGGPATQAQIGARNVAVGSDDSVYFGDQSRIRRIGQR